MDFATPPEDLENFPYIYANGAYRKLPVYEQSVSIVASLDNGKDEEDEGEKSLMLSLGLSSDDLPLVIGIGSGIVVLLLIIFVLLICSCRRHRTKTNHPSYSVQPDSFSHPDLIHEGRNGTTQSERVGTNYESYLIEKVPNNDSDPNNDAVKKRPMSQPIEMIMHDKLTKKAPSVDMLDEEQMYATLPKPQKTVQSCEFLSSGLPGMFISCEELDEVTSRDRNVGRNQTLDSCVKSRSLPNWPKSKQRPLSTTDDIRELAAKVNYTKKRKNRMKNDSAAAIALTRSRTNILTHTDTESLVDNEAVVVYDERTAL